MHIKDHFSVSNLPGTRQDKLHILQVVRRYGPVGGMERYVWELTLHFRQLGHQITVICERCHIEKPEGINVHELGEISTRPRWLAAMRFNQRVNEWLNAHPQSTAFIHSHERISAHDITTFHSTAFANVLEKPWWKLISFRIAMQLFMERRELSNARSIVPNSQLIKRQLAHYYPEFAHKLTEPVMPGVKMGLPRKPRTVPANGGVIGFVGKEWKRKGLQTAISIVSRLRHRRPNLKFIVVGPDSDEIKHLFSGWENGYILKGWCNSVQYDEFDVLLHPAKAEPYGMVISEALAAKVPVVISDTCGASVHVAAASGAVLPLSSPINDWVETVNQQLNRTDGIPAYQRSWIEVAQEYEAVWRNSVNPFNSAI